MTTQQIRLIQIVVHNAILEDDRCTHIKTDRYKGISSVAVKSLLNKGLIALHPELSTCDSGNYHLLPAGKLASIIEEVSEWQYGELFEYFDGNGIEYDPDDYLYSLQRLAISVRLKTLLR